MTNLELFNLLRPIVTLVTGYTSVILADQNSPAPQGPYVTIRPRSSVTEHGQAILHNKDAAGNLIRTDVRSQIIASCSLNFFRGEAMYAAELVRQCNKRPDVQMMLARSKLGWWGTDATNNLTALQASNWEQRAQLTIRVAFETSQLSTVNNILTSTVRVENEHADTLLEVDLPV